jgi:8-oxo-dGTP diphosphatase
VTTTELTIWPRPGVSVVVVRDGRVLIVRRSKPPLLGLWSFPGGHIEPGERAVEAALRELKEETAVEAVIEGILDVRDVLVGDRAELRAHYVLAVYYATWRAGDPISATDVDDARFVRTEELTSYVLTEGVRSLAERAIELLSCRHQ